MFSNNVYNKRNVYVILWNASHGPYKKWLVIPTFADYPSTIVELDGRHHRRTKQIRSSKNKGSAEIVNGKTNISVINASCCRNIRFTLGFNTVLVEVLFH